MALLFKSVSGFLQCHSQIKLCKLLDRITKTKHYEFQLLRCFSIIRRFVWSWTKRRRNTSSCWMLPWKKSPLRSSSKNREEGGCLWRMDKPPFFPRSKGTARPVGCYERMHSGMEGTSCHAYNPGLWEMLFPYQTKRLCGLLCRDSCFLLRKETHSDRHNSSRPQGSSTRFQSNPNIAELLK